MKKDFLAEFAVMSHRRAKRLATDFHKFQALIEQSVSPPGLRLSADGFDLIAEYKLRSPALGKLARPTVDMDRQLSDYAKGGAAVISVLTEPAHFDGSLLHLSDAARLMTKVDIPVMRKDFLVDPLQLYEARAAGAGGVLLIIRILDDPALENMLDCAAALGLFVLAESFDRSDLSRLAEVSVSREDQQILAGVNCRDLSTLELRPERFLELAPFVPTALPAVAESGITHSTDLPLLADAGYRLALIGGALMRHARPADFLSECLGGVRNRAARMAGGE
ncbi:MAG: indole-3-glycerol phosphate synthase TrpC [Gammaproteobacteria bacterium]|nr:indole-3-glycerol phosphate synthase TrpC [Gammaproteobacteria bacterium]MCZ6911911.1 indole-3-glycerol phosphate synthase TrpC [Pseudomonadota bacterium]